MPSKNNDTGSRIKSATRGSFVRRAPAKFTLGEPDEIAARVGGTFRTLPDNVPSNFKQLGPDGGGATPQDRKLTRYSGNQKVGDPRRYA